MPMSPRLLRPLANRFLLDQYGGAAVAYSLRRLRAGYTGPAVQVRRSNDSAEDTFTPEQVANGTLASWVGANDGFVKTWYDQSGNGNNLVQGTAGNQPKIVSSGSVITDQSQPAVQFDPARNDRLLTASSVNLGTQCSFFVVARLTRNHSDFSRLINGMDDNKIFIGTNASEQIATFYGDGTAWGVTTAQTSTTWLNQTRLVTTINNGSDNQWINGVSSGNRSNALGSFNSTISVGGVYKTGVTDFFNQMWQGSVSELVVYASERLTQRLGIERLILSHYSLT